MKKKSRSKGVRLLLAFILVISLASLVFLFYKIFNNKVSQSRSEKDLNDIEIITNDTPQTPGLTAFQFSYYRNGDSSSTDYKFNSELEFVEKEPTPTSENYSGKYVAGRYVFTQKAYIKNGSPTGEEIYVSIEGNKSKLILKKSTESTLRIVLKVLDNGNIIYRQDLPWDINDTEEALSKRLFNIKITDSSGLTRNLNPVPVSSFGEFGVGVYKNRFFVTKGSGLASEFIGTVFLYDIKTLRRYEITNELLVCSSSNLYFDELNGILYYIGSKTKGNSCLGYTGLNKKDSVFVMSYNVKTRERSILGKVEKLGGISRIPSFHSLDVRNSELVYSQSNDDTTVVYKLNLTTFMSRRYDIEKRLSIRDCTDRIESRYLYCIGIFDGVDNKNDPIQEVYVVDLSAPDNINLHKISLPTEIEQNSGAFLDFSIK